MADEKIYTNIGHVTAYAYAKSKGYTGSEDQFATDQANFAANAQQVRGDKESVEATVETFDNTTVPAAVQTVTAEGTRQVGIVGTAGDTQVGVVQTEGTTQKNAVQAKGNEVIASIPSDYTELTEEVEDLKSSVDDIDDLLRTGDSDETVAFSSFDINHAAVSMSDTSPFILDGADYSLFENKLVSKIKLNVSSSGILSIGVIKKSDAVYGATADRAKAVVKTIETITETGIIEIELTTPFSVASDEYLFFCIPSDTCRWKYGYSAQDKGFRYVGSSGNWINSNSSIGIDVYVKGISELSVRSAINSVYKDKTLSILGDSISTFTGYIPEGNLTYYPAGTVQAVTDTWWKKLADALGMTIDVNNSWSGSRVTTTSGDTSAGCMTRAESLGESPDVIIVWMGINDFNNDVALGTYDGKSAIPETTTTFREAYGIMLNKILTAYKTSEVWVCTLPQCERNGTEEFPEINGNSVALADFNVAIRELADSFGVRVLEHNKCGLNYQNMSVYNPDKLHPNKYGHSLIANNDIWQMDNAVAKRYPIA